MTLPSHKSHKWLADLLLFLKKYTAFTQVSEGTVDKIIRNSLTKSCLLDLWPTFLFKECSDILLPSITKLVNCSLMEDYVPDGFNTAVVTPLFKKATLLTVDLKKKSVYIWPQIHIKIGWISSCKAPVRTYPCPYLRQYISAYKTGHSTKTALLSIKNEVHFFLLRSENVK